MARVLSILPWALLLSLLRHFKETLWSDKQQQQKKNKQKPLPSLGAMGGKLFESLPQLSLSSPASRAPFLDRHSLSEAPEASSDHVSQVWLVRLAAVECWSTTLQGKVLVWMSTILISRVVVWVHNSQHSRKMSQMTFTSRSKLASAHHFWRGEPVLAWGLLGHKIKKKILYKKRHIPTFLVLAFDCGDRIWGVVMRQWLHYTEAEKAKE